MMPQILSDVDVGGNYEFVISHFGGKKPGVTVTCMGVAALQITYKDRGHKLRHVFLLRGPDFFLQVNFPKVLIGESALKT